MKRICKPVTCCSLPPAAAHKVSHAGIYVGEGRFVHAPQTGGTVKLDTVSKAYWQNAYLSAKRVLPAEHLAP